MPLTLHLSLQAAEPCQKQPLLAVAFEGYSATSEAEPQKLFALAGQPLETASGGRINSYSLKSGSSVCLTIAGMHAKVVGGMKSSSAESSVNFSAGDHSQNRMGIRFCMI